MKQKISFLFLFLLSGCIGTDIIPDFVEARVQIDQDITSLAVGTTHQFEANFTNEVGEAIEGEILWKSSNTSVMSIDENTGLATALAEGTTDIIASLDNGEVSLSDTINVQVGNETIAASNERTGMLQGFRSYRLSGDMKLTDNGDGTLTLSFGENFSFSGAPGPYIYLSNNPTSIANAIEISKLPQNSGAFEISNITGATLNQYSHVLFWCKPFQIKLGDGAFDN